MEVLCIIRVLNRAVIPKKQQFLFTGFYNKGEHVHFKTFTFQVVTRLSEISDTPEAPRVQS